MPRFSRRAWKLIPLLVFGVIIFLGLYHPSQQPHHGQVVSAEKSAYFPYIYNGSQICPPSTTNSNLLIAIVHSSANHFFQRRIIRMTWTSLRSVPIDFQLRVAFLLGLPARDDANTQEQIENEVREHNDIVQFGFVDHYQNLSMKHLMGYEWALTFCDSATYIIKTDDDVFVDIFRVSTFMRQTFVSPNNVLLCSVIPKGTTPRRKGKWAVTHEEYPFQTYPRYCSGMGYVITPDVVRILLEASRDGRGGFLWIDDVYVTGILAQRVGVVQKPVNVRYTDDQKVIAKWLNAKSLKTSPFMFAEVGRVLWAQTMIQLWNKTLKAWT